MIYQVILCFLILVHHQTVCQHVSDVVEISCTAGSTVQLPCEVGTRFWNANPDAGVSWYRCSDTTCNQLLITYTATEKLIVKQDAKRISFQSRKIKQPHFSIIIKDIHHQDEGLYQCVVYNLHQIETTHTVHLKVTNAQQSHLNTRPSDSLNIQAGLTTVSFKEQSRIERSSLLSTVTITALCVTSIFLGPLLFFFWKYRQHQQRTGGTCSRSNLGQRMGDEHIYAEVFTNAFQNSISGDEMEEDYESVHYEMLRRDNSYNDVYSDCNQSFGIR
ncbi:uncharacterized protein [Lepisosteus oculatus]|uniref:uncharacterized protein n=1 Tax=Lepisosteus oculatus TaxID=7918 RepID=UPI00073FB169|nr:PREDICTED: uncharacterized protein LOC107077701 [Lepisosteus oculatus]